MQFTKLNGDKCGSEREEFEKLCQLARVNNTLVTLIFMIALKLRHELKEFIDCFA